MDSDSITITVSGPLARYVVTGLFVLVAGAISTQHLLPRSPVTNVAPIQQPPSAVVSPTPGPFDRL